VAQAISMTRVSAAKPPARTGVSKKPGKQFCEGATVAHRSELDAFHGPCALSGASCAIRVVFDANGDALKALLEPQPAAVSHMHYEVQAEVPHDLLASGADQTKTVSLIVPVRTKL
jgi:hypothetical protein